MHIKNWLFIALIFSCFLPLAGDIGIYNLQNDRLYLDELTTESNHSSQFHTSRDLDDINSFNVKDFGIGSLSIFTPTIFTSVNSNNSWGINDGALWQGRGFNGQMETGVIFNSKYVNIRFIPEVWYAQNSDFETTPSAYPDEDTPRSSWGSVISGIDAYQRPGDTYLYDFNWGKSGIEFNYKMFQLEASTDNFSLGPGRVSPIIMSDNSEGFPHLRLGLNRWETKIGVFEYNAIWGILEESEFFDSDSDNNNNLFSGYNFAYSPSFFPGFTIGLNRTLIASMSIASPEVAFKIYDPGIGGGLIGDNYGYDETDQRASLVVDWSMPDSGFRLYGELGKNDYSTDLKLLLRTPEHAAGVTLGLSKKISNFLLEAEYTELINSRDYELGGLGTKGTFYRHHIVDQGYTNNGQLLGAGIGSGSDAQTISLSFFGKKHQIKGYLQRVGLIKDYIYGGHYDGHLEDEPNYPVSQLQYEMILGVSCLVELNNFTLYGEIAPSLRFSNNFDPDQDTFNFYGALGLNYLF